jgi:hypothetical protein
MFNGKVKSIKSVVYNVIGQSFMTDISEEQAMHYAYDLIRLMKMGFMLDQKVEDVKIKNYKAKIPDKLVTLRGVRYFSDKLNAEYQPMHYDSDIFQSDFHCNEYRENSLCEVTYTLNNNYIITNQKEGFINVSHYAINVDEEGYPMIPDSRSFEQAIEYYIMQKHLFGLRALGKVSKDFYEEVKQEYAFYIGQAESDLKLAGMDHWDTAMKGINRLIQDKGAARKGFKGLFREERIKRQR